MAVRAYVEGGIRRYQWVLLAAAALLAVVLNNGPVAILGSAAAAMLTVRAVRVRIVGGGFRPLSTIELLDAVAGDDLDAMDRRQAESESRRKQDSMKRSRY